MNEASILDIISPIMVGPSSSHTAGAVKIGLLAKNIYGMSIKKVDITLYNSYATTGIGHGTDKGILSGLLGYSPDNTIIKDIFNSSSAQKIDYDFKYKQSFSHHPNSVKIIFDDKMTINAQSIGGGEVLINKIDEFNVNITGKYHTLIMIAPDTPGVLSKITKYIQKDNINIASLNCERNAIGKNASTCIMLDSEISENTINEIKNSIKPVYIRYVKKLEY